MSANSLLELLASSDRGARREGLFAVWLTVRVALDQGTEPRMPERAQRRRLDALERRVARLTLSAPLKRALAGTLALLRENEPNAAAIALQQLTTPVRETLGVEAGEILADAAAGARRRSPEALPGHK